MRVPDFFIVGAPKSGTTAMNEYLRQHPQVFVPWKKEAHFFGTDLLSPWFMRDRQEYLALFSGARDEKRVGESSVWYLYSKRAASEIKAFCPEARIIIMLRNPVDMIYAQHSQFLFNGNEEVTDLEAALEAEEDRKQGRRIPDTAHFVQGLFYRETAKYTQQLQRYLGLFGWENVHIILYDDFQRDNGAVYARLLRFLDVDGDFRPDFKVINPNKRVRSEKLRDVLHKRPELARRLADSLIPKRVQNALYRRIKRLNTQYESRPPMDPRLRERLQREFEPEVRRLSELLGQDLTHWCPY